MKSCLVYRRNDGWYIHADSITTSGAGIARPPYIKQPRSVNAFELGSEALRALRESGPAAHPYPTDLNAVFDPMLELAGVKTWGKFAKGAVCIRLQLDDGGITCLPMHNDGRGNFLAVGGRTIVIAVDAGPLQVGEAILRALGSTEKGTG